MKKPTSKNPHAVALGRIKSPRKAEAARRNGKLGGAPKKLHKLKNTAEVYQPIEQTAEDWE